VQRWQKEYAYDKMKRTRNNQNQNGEGEAMSTKYGFSKKLDIPYEQAVEAVSAALKTEGFGVLTEIDVKATLKKKLDVDFRRYVILGACNPPLAHQALTTDLEIGLLLPCNVVVREADDGGVVVAFMDPAEVLKLVERPELEALGAEVKSRLEEGVYLFELDFA